MDFTERGLSEPELESSNIMLLRSSSSPVLDSFIGHQAEPEVKVNSSFRRYRSVSVSLGLHVTDDGNGGSPMGISKVEPKLKKVQSDTDLNHHPKLGIGLNRPWPRRTRSKSYGSSDKMFERKSSLDEVFSNVRLEEAPEEEELEDSPIQFSIGSENFEHPHGVKSVGAGSGDGVAFASASILEGKNSMLMGFDGMEFGATASASLVCNRPAQESENEMKSVYTSGGRGSGYGGGLSGGGWGGRGGGSDSDPNSTEAYYQRMLQANPDNPLLLRNYAKFLHEVQHDLMKAEEYYGRAILASPGDGDTLSLYAKLIYDVHKDAPRAESYFDRAVEAAPDDCYVLGSYAHFLWNAEDEGEEEEEDDTILQPNRVPKTLYGTAVAAS